MLNAILTLLARNTADTFILMDLLTKSKNFQVILHSFCFNCWFFLWSQPLKLLFWTFGGVECLNVLIVPRKPHILFLGLPKHECLYCYPVATERYSQRHLATGLRLQHSYIGAT